MYKKISKTKKILTKLNKEGKIKVLDSPEDLNKIESINKYMEDVRKDYIRKSKQSEISASKLILN